MSTATVQTPQQQTPPPSSRPLRAASAQGYRQHLRTRSSPPPPPPTARSASHPHPSRPHKDVAIDKHVESVRIRQVLSPEAMAKDAGIKQRPALSSPHLTVTDFELMRTLGTGKDRSIEHGAPVWLRS